MLFPHYFNQRNTYDWFHHKIVYSSSPVNKYHHLPIFLPDIAEDTKYKNGPSCNILNIKRALINQWETA